jgi:polar amino acid transport system substrate-binding protein
MVFADSEGTLARLRKAGVVKIAIPQTPPWSEIKPDGSLAGIAPEIILPALKAMGIERYEAIPASYAELIPGMLAGRWDLCGASLTISHARCAAVAFPSPFCFGYLAVAYRPDDMTDPPLSMAEAGKRGLKIATNAGGFQLAALRKVAKPDNLLLFNDVGSVVEAVASKRADIAIDVYAGMNLIKTSTRIAFTGALSDMGYTSSGAAFRKTDADFYEAFDVEIRKLKASGFVAQINEKYGTPYLRDQYDKIDGPMACESTAI